MEEKDATKHAHPPTTLFLRQKEGEVGHPSVQGSWIKGRKWIVMDLGSRIYTHMKVIINTLVWSLMDTL